MSQTPTASFDAEKDAALLRAIATGETAALGELYDRLSRPIYALALRVVNDAREAEDIVQETFLQLWEHAATFDAARGTVFSWAATFARNRAIDRVRRRNRRRELIAEAALEAAHVGSDVQESDAAEAAGLSERAACVRQALASLSSDQKQAVELAFFSGLTHQEISERLRQPLGTVKARIRRGLLRLKEALSS